MQQLWLSSPALGSCLPSLGRFKASNNLVKLTNFGMILLQAKISPHWTSAIQILVSEIQSKLRYYILNCTHFWPCYLIWYILDILHQLLHNFYSIS